METNYISKYESFIKNMVVDESGIWAYPAYMLKCELPAKGFKIHISAVYSNVVYILNNVLPYLNENKVPYKVLASIKDLMKMNSGEYGYSQIGKVITIYPRREEEFCLLLENLDNRTKGFCSVHIPSDYRYKGSTVVYYRYGEFIEKENYKDCRLKGISTDLVVPTSDYYIKRLSVFPEPFRIICCVRTRGKSKVYFCINTKEKKKCIAKEGVMLGELAPDGRDGMDLVSNEYEMLKRLEQCDFIPNVYDVFYRENSIWLIEEFIEGESLLSILYDNPESLVLIRDKIFLELCIYVETILAMNIFPYDLSPDNIMLNKGKVYLIDIEQYSMDENKAYPGMNGFWFDKYAGKKLVYFSLLAILYYLYHPERIKDFTKEINIVQMRNLQDIYMEFAETEITEKKIKEKAHTISMYIKEGV